MIASMAHDDFPTPTEPSHERDALVQRVDDARTQLREARFPRVAIDQKALEADPYRWSHFYKERLSEVLASAEAALAAHDAQARTNLGGRDSSPRRDAPGALCGTRKV